MPGGMFDSEQRSRSEEAGREDGGWDAGEAFHVVWRVGEHEVEACRGGGYVAHGVASDEPEVSGAEFGGHFGYEFLLYRRFFHCGYCVAFAGEEFEAHGAGAGEEVEGVAVVEVDQVLEHIEYVFPREIGCGSCGNV